jgi:2-haloacid dehalogenase
MPQVRWNQWRLQPLGTLSPWKNDFFRKLFNRASVPSGILSLGAHSFGPENSRRSRSVSGSRREDHKELFPMLDFSRYQAITFDCYGTLVDWETGIFSALRPILAAHKQSVSDAAVLELYGELEASAEAGEFKDYRDVLGSVVAGFGERLGFAPSQAEIRSLAESVANWQPFPDTVTALERLQSRFKLSIISNIDDDLFATTAPKLEVRFDHVITAQQARSYKPSLNNFRIALQRIGLPPDRLLHVGQSIYHDVVPAKSLGIATVWVNRPSPRAGVGAVKAAMGVPDLEVRDLASLAEAALGG